VAIFVPRELAAKGRLLIIFSATDPTFVIFCYAVFLCNVKWTTCTKWSRDLSPKAWFTRRHNHNRNHNEVIRNGKVCISYDYEYDYDIEIKRVNRDLL